MEYHILHGVHVFFLTMHINGPASVGLVAQESKEHCLHGNRNI